MSLQNSENRPDADAIKIAREFGNLVEKQGVPVQKVLLFGSRARGKWNNWSDVDVCVVSPSFGKNMLEELGFLIRLTAKLGSRLPIEPIPFAPDDLVDKFSTLASEIRKYGISVDLEEK